MRSKLWHLWCDAMGQKADPLNNKHSDNVTIIRTIIFFSILATNIMICSGIIKHWHDNDKKEETLTNI